MRAEQSVLDFARPMGGGLEQGQPPPDRNGDEFAGHFAQQEIQHGIDAAPDRVGHAGLKKWLTQRRKDESSAGDGLRTPGRIPILSLARSMRSLRMWREFVLVLGQVMVEKLQDAAAVLVAGHSQGLVVLGAFDDPQFLGVAGVVERAYAPCPA